MPKRKTTKRRKKKVVKHRVKKASLKPEDSVHVRITQPISNRKEVLMTGIQVVELLKKAKKIKDLHKQKKAEMKKFESVMADVQILVKQIRMKELPLKQSQLKEVRDARGRKIIPDLVAPSAPRSPSSLKSVPVPSKTSIDSQLDALRRKLETL